MDYYSQLSLDIAHHNRNPKMKDVLIRNQIIFSNIMFKSVWLLYFCNRGMLGENEL